MTIDRWRGALAGVEQAMWMLFDAMVPELRQATGQSVDYLRRRHTNLE